MLKGPISILEEDEGVQALVGRNKADQCILSSPPSLRTSPMSR